VHAGLLVAPIIPGVTDDRPGLEQLMRAAKEAGAHYVVGSALRLGPAARHRFLPVLSREFPQLAERYRRHFARSESTSSDYQRALARRLRRLQQILGFPLDDEGRHHRQVEEHESRAPEGPAQPTLL
jgi:DNA repair photolyase